MSIMDFKGKVAIVTGGGQGIGKAICKTFLDMGMKVCICDIDENAIKSFFDELSDEEKLSAITTKCDVSSVDALRETFEKTHTEFGRIGILVNNAGILNEHEWRKVIDVNFIGVIHGIHLAFEFMGTNYGGSGGYVINTASNTGLEPFPFAPIYSGCKHGVVGLTRSYGAQYHFDRTGVTVNAVCPGPTDTPLFHASPSLSLDEKVLGEFCSTLKPVSSFEIAKGVVKLLQDGKNGALLRVDSDGTRYVE